MTDFFRGPLVPIPDHFMIPAALGASAGTKLTSLDLGKLVKLSASGLGPYILCVSGDDIEGQLVAVEPNTVNDGFGFGTVQQQGAIVATVETATLALRAYVVAGTITAVGTAITPTSSGNNIGTVAPKVIAGAGTVFKWRVCSLLGGDGTVGTQVLIERVV